MPVCPWFFEFADEVEYFIDCALSEVAFIATRWDAKVRLSWAPRFWPRFKYWFEF